MKGDVSVNDDVFIMTLSDVLFLLEKPAFAGLPALGIRCIRVSFRNVQQHTSLLFAGRSWSHVADEQTLTVDAPPTSAPPSQPHHASSIPTPRPPHLRLQKEPVSALLVVAYRARLGNGNGGFRGIDVDDSLPDWEWRPCRKMGVPSDSEVRCSTDLTSSSLSYLSLLLFFPSLGFKDMFGTVLLHQNQLRFIKFTLKQFHIGVATISRECLSEESDDDPAPDDVVQHDTWNVAILHRSAPSRFICSDFRQKNTTVSPNSCYSPAMISISLQVQSSRDNVHVYDFHIVYSFSYKVPVLYFQGLQSGMHIP
ncbi:uncharacterized protein LOC123428616 [Hordeum vulgare subsp. vulgare]|uniref:uncharacterized protein LOC123428616 n=1 Tax=Hordeum vulgare subsp. vulgare TaxID=112509 RepID=UPI001D1A57AD|nr:uncharacterized protein LOC123428616 [Hordeum vulgare subsp. vulgare]